MPGAPDPQYVAARRALLDALGALSGHRDAIVVVGAQAIYQHTGSSDFAIPEHTTDGDLAIDPAGLGDTPKIAEAMGRAGFHLDPQQPGTWTNAGSMQIDLLVPEALGGPGRRGARLGIHVRAVVPLENPTRVIATSVTLANDLFAAIEGGK